MTTDEVDAYLTRLSAPEREALAALRRSIRAVVPDAEECLSYGLPAFRVAGTVVAGFGAFQHHLAYLPHSGDVLPALGERLDGYEHTRGSLHFTVEQPLPDGLVRELLSARLALIGRGTSS